MDNLKTCNNCNKTKKLYCFYKNSNKIDGHENVCKECRLQKSKDRTERLKKNPEWVENERRRSREKYHRLNYSEKLRASPEKRKEKLYKSRKLYPEKHSAVYAAKKIKSYGFYKHHWSYKKNHWLDVIFLTLKDHLKAHRFIIYDQERMMYRDLNGLLLDSREKHFNYIMKKITNEPD